MIVHIITRFGMKGGVKFVALKLQQKYVLQSFLKRKCQIKALDIHIFYLGNRKITDFIEILKT